MTTLNLLNYTLLTNLFIFSTFLFSVGSVGLFLTRKNLIIILVCIEILFASITIILGLFSVILQDTLANSFVFFILAAAGADAAIGLAILVIFFRIRGGSSTDSTKSLRG